MKKPERYGDLERVGEWLKRVTEIFAKNAEGSKKGAGINGVSAEITDGMIRIEYEQDSVLLTESEFVSLIMSLNSLGLVDY